ncbi:multiple sugar transport system substrate-binding protein/putative aldouronate transport system substrate-binding protein [Arthrobacter stackebrandtii]|uniref:Multiple sugar transport system substrate-binding protein/putative aldouronate transport system substrate-binding protein n=1 Tax=Arthrobacter stackebrandtii TaxID=272161 RepID=A0ABS4YTQ7_9MICC|nr:extracellular solute-binding protein [Arthrobacter stackebrandtii]MBP2412177.1 multiple sugar transport system substrate-binding protein/putative aldouronate transport system substrate-binding protein [Arthrobacter stackebrandtii]PYH01970.1 sugar ABC transporter substrate-binding protein [Arthrobacter stackebrandtii]
MTPFTFKTPPVSRRAFITGIAATGLFAMVGCSSKPKAEVDITTQNFGAMENFAADTQFKSTEALNLGLLWTDWPDTPVKDSWEIFKEIKSRTNVTLDLTHIPFSDAKEKRSLLISAGDAPSIIPLIYTGEEEAFVSSGAVLPLSDYSDMMPNFKKYATEWDLEAMVENLRQSDGKYYMMPGLQEVSVPVFSVVLRKDVFEEVGGGIPDTWDELRTAMLKIKEKYPDSYPLADGFEGQSLLNYAARAFGTQAGWGFGNGMMWDESAGKFKYAATSDEYKEMVTYFHGLVEDGLLDVESMTAADAGGGNATVSEKFANSKIFAASGSTNTAIEYSIALDKTLGAGAYKVGLVPPPSGPAGNIVEPRNFWHGFMISSKAKDEPNFLALLQFLDWFYYNPEARELLRWGVEGKHYTKDAAGTITLNKEFSLDARNLNPDGKTDLEVDLGFATFPSESTESRKLKESYSTPEDVEYIDAVLSTRTPLAPTPPAPLEEGELEQASLTATPLKDTVDTNTLKFILGQRDLSEWGAFVKELEGQGLAGYVDLMNNARERFAAKA